MLGRFGACLAVASSLLVVAALPSMASAHDNPPAPGHFTTKLTPGEEPAGGDRGGSGDAQLHLDQARQTACYTLSWKGLTGVVTAAHLHIGPRGQDGGHAIDFFNNQQFPGGQSTASGCVPTTPDMIKAIIAQPSGYYINVHSSDFKPGAIRGQLG